MAIKDTKGFEFKTLEKKLDDVAPSSDPFQSINIGLPAMHSIRGTDCNDKIYVHKELTTFPGAEIDGGKGNDEFVFKMSKIETGAKFFINDSQGSNSIILQMTSEFKLMPNIFKPKVKGVAVEDRPFHFAINGVTFVFKSSEVQNIFLEFKGKRTSLLEATGDKMFYINPLAEKDNELTAKLDVEGTQFRRGLLLSSQIASSPSKKSDVTSLQKSSNTTLTKS